MSAVVPAGSRRTFDGLSAPAVEKARLANKATSNAARNCFVEQHIVTSPLMQRLRGFQNFLMQACARSKQIQKKKRGGLKAPARQVLQKMNVKTERVKVLSGVNELHVRCLGKMVGVNCAQILATACRGQGYHAVVGTLDGAQQAPSTAQ